MTLWIFCLAALSARAIAADYAAPAGKRAPFRSLTGESILPGGRLLHPLGQQYMTGPGPFGLAINPTGNILVSANGGPDRYSLTVLEKDKGRWISRHLVAPRKNDPEGDDDDWRSVFMGIAFADSKALWASDGNSGGVRLIQTASGSRRKTISLNQAGFNDSYTADLAIDNVRGLLYVVDQANFRVAVVDVKRGRVMSSVKVGRLPFAIALSPDARRAYVTNIGMFEYRAIPGADLKRGETGLPFPAFGFPSAEARAGVRRQTVAGVSVDVPGLGDPNVKESNSLAVINVENPASPKVERFIQTGIPWGKGTLGGSSPSGVLAAGGKIFVSNAHNDSITVIDAGTLAVTAEIQLRIPGLEGLRGVLPLGMAWNSATGWLLVAEAGINAVGVVDTSANRLLGHLPAGWFPTRVLVDRDNVYVCNAKGIGVGPNAAQNGAHYMSPESSFMGTLRRGTVSTYPLPDAAELGAHTRRVFEYNGLFPREEAAHKESAATPPAAIKRVVLIVKENRTFDEVFGDIVKAPDGPVRSAPLLARFGRGGFVYGGSNRLSFKSVNVTPNHHSMASRGSMSDNFHADSEMSVDGHHWLVGSYPNAWTESTLMAAGGGQKDFRLPTSAPGRLLFAGSNSSVHPEEQLDAGTLWHHLERAGITFRNYGEGFELAGVDEGTGLKPTGAGVLTNVPMPDPLYRNTSKAYPMYNMNIPDQFRADVFIKEIREKYVEGGEAFPRFIYIHLPNDHIAKPRPEDGYPYEASYVADNDYALGRIIEFLSNTPWWKEMAVFVTEDDAQGGRDHVDAHRTVLLAMGPYVKKGYVSRVNAGFPGLLKTVFRIFGMPPLNLFDAVASDLSDLFTPQPDFTPYQLEPVDSRLFVPSEAREPKDPKPGPKMDDPKVLREQHKR